ncbi:MAG: dUTP diphosphatase [Planctomycetota bacterium]|nr:dUTP diphosphatase [Planctomycetota bacterium]
MKAQHPPLKVKLLNARAMVPKYQTAGAAGMDLAACFATDDTTLELAPGQIRAIPTALSIAVAPGYEAQVRPRSGLSTKHGVTLPNAPGTIDSDYRGEVLVPLINHGKEPFTITHGMRVAQLVIAPVAQVRIDVVEALDATDRGEGGFGSTGRH